MGLGKTIQVIALLCNLYEEDITSRNLIVVPLSTIPNWKNEFKRFAPKLPVIILHGTREERQHLKNQAMKRFAVDNKSVSPIIVTTYNTITADRSFFSQSNWNYVIIDEGQRIKNYKSALAR